MDTSFDEKLMKYEHAAVHRRGHVLQQAILFERVMDYYIAYHFSETEALRQELMELIICDRMPFSSKWEVLDFLLKKYEKPFLEKFPNFRTDVVRLMEQRNIFDHYQLNASSQAINDFDNDTITFVKYKNSINLIKYTKKDVQEIIDKASVCTVLLNSFINKK